MRFRIGAIWVILTVSILWGYYIKDFNDEITIHPDGTLTITEKITADFESELRHGIYRDIIYKYKVPSKWGTYKRRLSIKILSVTDEHGNNYKYKTIRRGRYLRIRIGDPDKYVSGVMTYVIKYSVYGALNEFENSFELWWEITGHEWSVSIQRASATFYLPENVDIENVMAVCFTGNYGSTASDCEHTKDPAAKAVHFISGYLKPKQGFSAAVSIPKIGTDGKPTIRLSRTKAILWFITTNFWQLLIMLIFIPLPAITGIWLFIKWFKHGRDPLKGQPIMVRYKPPDDVNPAELGTIIDEKADPQDISASIIDLAVRGYLKIVEQEGKGKLFFKSKDYALVLMKNYDNASDLNEFEKKLLKYLFLAGNDAGKSPKDVGVPEGKDLIMVSTLKDKFYKYFNLLKGILYKSLVKRGYFPHNPESVRSAYGATGIIMMAMGIFLAAFLHSWVLLWGLVVSGVLFVFFANFMPRKTRKGAAMANYARGLEEFIRRAEQDRIKRLAQEDPTIFDRILPYAMVLRCADEWVEKFKGIFDEPPDWYHGTGRMSFIGFAHGIGDATTVMSHTVSSSPRGSAAGGGSAFSGGGGFSGGGFGGGGGGAW